jgi:hypothetical protein
MAAVGLAREQEVEARLRELLGSERYGDLRELLTEARTILAEAR